MNSLPLPDESLWADEGPTKVLWQKNPLYRGGLRSLAVFLGLLCLGAAVFEITGRVPLAMMSVVTVFAAAWRSFIPVRYELNHEGVNRWILGRHRRIPWEAVRRFEIGSAGVLLLPYADRSPLDPLRGHYLPWKDNRDVVLSYIHYALDRYERASVT